MHKYIPISIICIESFLRLWLCIRQNVTQNAKWTDTQRRAIHVWAAGRHTHTQIWKLSETDSEWKEDKRRIRSLFCACVLGDSSCVVVDVLAAIKAWVVNYYYYRHFDLQYSFFFHECRQARQISQSSHDDNKFLIHFISDNSAHELYEYIFLLQWYIAFMQKFNIWKNKLMRARCYFEDSCRQFGR